MGLSYLKKLHNFYEPINDKLMEYLKENVDENTIDLQYLNETLRREFYLQSTWEIKL